MEAMRFAEMEEQSSLWNTLYSVRKDYDDLSTSTRPVNKDPQILFNDDDTSDDDEFSIQRPAFRVDGQPDFDPAPPDDGLEYLRRVRWEAAKIPNVRVVKLEKNKLNKEQSDYMPNIPEISKCPDHLLPSKLWEDAFLAEFSQLRLALSRLDISSFKRSIEHPTPTVLAEERCSHLPYGHIMLDGSEKIESDLPDFSGSENDNDQLSTDEDNSISAPMDKPVSKPSLNEDFSEYPLLSVISRMDSVARVSMLKKRINSLQDMNSLPKNECLRLFTLC